MNKKIRKVLAIIMAVVCVFGSLTTAYAQAKSLSTSNITTLILEDESGNDVKLVVEEAMNSRTTKLYDSTGNLIQTLVLDKESGVLSNLETGVQREMHELKSINPGVCNYSLTTDYEYEFCSLGDTYSTDEEVTVAEIKAMVGTTFTVTKVTAYLITLGAFAGVKSAVKTLITNCAKKIVAKENAGDTSAVVTMTFTFKCQEQWESDSSYPDGGFYFLGYLPYDFDYSID